ncbi:MAG: GNAT family N-acetyltransferase, partial [Vulcanimicrobiota bacterium]
MFFFDSWFKNIDFKVLGERCYLTPLQKKDLATVKKWFDDKELLKFAFGVQTDPNTIERIGKNYLKSIFKSSTEIFGIWSCKNQLLGFINYSRRNYQEDIARIGILIGKEGNRSKGIGTEAMNMALLYLFDRIGVDKVDLDTAIFNKR